jgi:hypothetical protein
VKAAALVWSILAIVAGAVCWFAFDFGLLTICFDACLPVSRAVPQLFIVAGVTLGPGILVSLLAWILGLFYLRSQGRAVWFRILVGTPLVAVVAMLPIMYLTGHSLAPTTEYSAPQPLIDRHWLAGPLYAIIPLMIAWPITCLIAALTRQRVSA